MEKYRSFFNANPNQNLRLKGLDLLPIINHLPENGSVGPNTGYTSPVFEERAFFSRLGGTTAYLEVPIRGSNTTNFPNSIDASMGIIVKGILFRTTTLGLDLTYPISFRHYGIRHLGNGNISSEFEVINEVNKYHTGVQPPFLTPPLNTTLSTSTTNYISINNNKFICALDLNGDGGGVVSFIKGTYLLI